MGLQFLGNVYEIYESKLDYGKSMKQNNNNEYISFYECILLIGRSWNSYELRETSQKLFSSFIRHIKREDYSSFGWNDDGFEYWRDL